MIGENGEEITKSISCKLQFIDSARFMASALEILLIILLKEFIKLNVNTSMIIKNVKRAELKTKIASARLNSQTLKMI